MRRLEGNRDPPIAELSQMRRLEGAREPNPEARAARRTGTATDDTEEPVRLL